MGGTSFLRGFDPVALSLIVLAVAFAAIVVVVAIRRRRNTPRWLRSKAARKRLDVIARDLDRLAEYGPGLPDIDPVLWQPVERGQNAMAACRFDQALEELAAAQPNSSGPLLVALHNQAGVCRYTLGRLDGALDEFRQAARLADRQGDKRGRAAALNNIGVIRHEYGELGGALRQLQAALALAREADNQPTVAVILANIGNVRHDKGDLIPALKSLEEALAIAKSFDDHEAVSACLGSIAGILRDQGEPDQALERYAEAMEEARKVNYRLGAATALSNIGGLYRDKDDLDRAIKSHESALGEFHEVKFRLGVAAELGNIGLILTRKRLFAPAVPYLAESLTFFLDAGAVNGPRQTLYGLSRCDDALGRERMRELLLRSGRSEESVTETLERIDLIRTRRPREGGGRRHPFAPPAPPQQASSD